jgi:hypothetical protein
LYNTTKQYTVFYIIPFVDLQWFKKQVAGVMRTKKDCEEEKCLIKTIPGSPRAQAALLSG